MKSSGFEQYSNCRFRLIFFAHYTISITKLKDCTRSNAFWGIELFPYICLR
ncbi:hypothetical protein HMPREF1989_01535 [Porphyromonas gingivalis F0566]|nr:hypothetical protein HMPREF1989_01535 [Porphyromonas gingivalis F0566]